MAVADQVVLPLSIDAGISSLRIDTFASLDVCDESISLVV